MTLNLIGLGLDLRSISVEALEVLKKCDEVYLENYTVDFPYSIDDLKRELGISVKELERERVEDESIVSDAREKEVALLVYGDSLSATTHMQLVLACNKGEVECRVFHNASVMNSVAVTGLQLYRFGKTASMPDWKEHTNHPTSFVNYIRENQSVGAHTLILTDIGLSLSRAIEQLKESCEREKVVIEKVIVLSRVGTDNQKVYFGKLDELKEKEILRPYCLVIPSELNHFEEEALEEICNQ